MPSWRKGAGVAVFAESRISAVLTAEKKELEIRDQGRGPASRSQEEKKETHPMIPQRKWEQGKKKAAPSSQARRHGRGGGIPPMFMKMKKKREGSVHSTPEKYLKRTFYRCSRWGEKTEEKETDIDDGEGESPRPK